LSKIGADRDFVRFSSEKTLAEVYKTCERADWLLKLFVHMSDCPLWPTSNTVHFCACDCVATGLLFLPANNKARRALEVCRSWRKGRVRPEEAEAMRRAMLEEAVRTVDTERRQSYVYSAAGDVFDPVFVPNAALTIASAFGASAWFSGDLTLAAREKVQAHQRMCRLIRERIARTEPVSV